ncbi:membrane protein insertase YidC [Candidatus Uhrbacteria bacterium]|nr:membrane protein insertase YidC [Candidatus Uhrbacteria bacterium]
MFLHLYNIILYQPLYNLLVFLYNVIPGHDLGIGIILITVLIRSILLPFTKHQVQAQKSMQDLQPKIDALKAQYPNDKEKLGKEMMRLYKEEKVNPVSSCLPLLVQLPIFYAVYRVFRDGLKSVNGALLYPFIANPGHLSTLAGAAQFWQTRMLLVKRPPREATATGVKGAKDEDTMAMVNKQMMYIMPVMTIFIGVSLPSGLSLYWLITTLISVAQQHLILKPKSPKVVVAS